MDPALICPLRERLREPIDLCLPAFCGSVAAGEVTQWYFRRRDAGEWYAALVERLVSARGYLPLYRMSDGEFVFVCGKRPLPLTMLLEFPKLVVKDRLKVLLRRHRRTYLSGTPGYGYETYTWAEWERARQGYADRVRAIGKAGILAVNFVRHLEFPRQYLEPMCSWMEAHDIDLTPTNYYPFYYVYAALLGPDARRLYEGRRILVVTSDEDGTKWPAIRQRVMRFGAADATFVRISRSKSMFDRIDVTRIGTVDLVLMGAGVGALNIAEQVAPLEALTIDAGFVLDCLWRPREFVGRRAFTRPDRPLSELQG
jgi:hypothetical protein